MANKTIVSMCGDGNRCLGTVEDYICICDAYGYVLDDNDKSQCSESKYIAF